MALQEGHGSLYRDLGLRGTMCLGPYHPRTKEGPSTLSWSSKNYWGKKVTVASSVDHAGVAAGSNEVSGLICHEFKP